MDKHGVSVLWDEENSHNERCGALVRCVFETPATTLPGIIEKLKIVGLAVDDEDLRAWQNLEDPWMAKVIRDLERLAGRSS